jgi:hypothetical protein
MDMTLAEYLKSVQEHNIVGGAHPWYIFKGNPISKIAEEENSVVPDEDCPTPSVLQESMDKFAKQGKGMVSKICVFFCLSPLTPSSYLFVMLQALEMYS